MVQSGANVMLPELDREDRDKHRDSKNRRDQEVEDRKRNSGETCSDVEYEHCNDHLTYLFLLGYRGLLS
jgi:hypothetical protein